MVKEENKEKNNLIQKEKHENKKNLWRISTIILAVIVLALIILFFRRGLTGNVINEGDASSALIDFLNQQVGGGVSLVSTEDIGSLYKVTVSYQGKEVPLYMTKDGEYMVQGAVPLTEQVAQNQQNQPTQQEVPKSDKPKVEAFVFSYCPYGLQFEKALLPVYKLLKDKADINIVFIGAMHGEYEKVESLRQLCVRKEYGEEKFWKYLEEFAGNEKIGDCKGNDECLTPLLDNLFSELGIDKAKIENCMEKDAESLYEQDNSRASQLGISGSPTFVINGVKVSVARNPEAIKKAICGAFNSEPSECGTKLSEQSASPWFGYANEGSGGGGGQC